MPEAVFWCSRLVSKSENVCPFHVFHFFKQNLKSLWLECMFFVCKGQYYAFNEQKGWWLPLDEVGYGTARGQDSKCHHDPVQATRSATPWPNSPQPTRLLHWDGATTRWRATGWAGRKLLPAEGHTKLEMGNGKGNIDILCFKKLQNLSAFFFYIFLHCLFLHLLSDSIPEAVDSANCNVTWQPNVVPHYKGEASLLCQISRQLFQQNRNRWRGMRPSWLCQTPTIHPELLGKFHENCSGLFFHPVNVRRFDETEVLGFFMELRTMPSSNCTGERSVQGFTPCPLPRFQTHKVLSEFPFSKTWGLPWGDGINAAWQNKKILLETNGWKQRVFEDLSLWLPRFWFECPTYGHTDWQGTCMHACIHACMHTSIHPYIHTSIHPYIHTSIHPYIHTSIHTYIHTNIQTYKPTNIQTYKHTYIHTCMHACTHWCFVRLCTSF